MNNAQTAAKLIEYADRCIAAYDAADPSDRSVAMKRALAECFTDFSSMKPNLQLGSREKVIFSLDNNPKRHSVLKHVRNARSDIPVDKFIMKLVMPELVTQEQAGPSTHSGTVSVGFSFPTIQFHWLARLKKHYLTPLKTLLFWTFSNAARHGALALLGSFP